MIERRGFIASALALLAAPFAAKGAPPLDTTSRRGVSLDEWRHQFGSDTLLLGRVASTDGKTAVVFELEVPRFDAELRVVSIVESPAPMWFGQLVTCKKTESGWRVSAGQA